MFCTKCGAQIESDAKFCPVCGNATQGAPVSAATPTPAPAPVAAKKVVGGSFIDSLRAFVVRNNNLLLIALGCSFISLLISFINAADVQGFGSALVSAAISAVPTIAVLLLYLEGKKTGPFSTVGFTVIKIYSWVVIVLVALAGLLMIVGADMLDDIFKGSSLDELMDKAGAILIVATLIVVGLVIGYYCVILSHCSRIEKAVKTNVRPVQSNALTVVLWIFGILSAISAVNSFSNATAMAAVSGVASATGTICYALLCGKAVKEL